MHKLAQKNALDGKHSVLINLKRSFLQVPIPEHIDIFYLSREMAPVDKTALECVMEVDHERIKLEAEAERLAASNDDGK